MREPPGPLAGFGEVERVVADPLRFKLKLRIGEAAYASLRLRKNLFDAWEIGGAAATGGALAASPVVASTFFASTASGGVLAWIGLGTAAATPIGWVAAAALASGGAYYGVTRVVRRYSESRVDTIPKFINTPIDLLGAALLDLIGGLALRLALVDGHLDESERQAIARHFISDWGYEPDYVERALDLLRAESEEKRVRQLARALAEFQAANPDCNADAMSREIVQFLREVAGADGRLDEREELALEAIERELVRQRRSAFARLRGAAGKAADTLAHAVGSRLKRQTS